MTSKPTQYEGFKEKLFWVIIGTIVTGTVAIVGLIWGMTIDVKMLQIDVAHVTNVQEKTWEIATRNNNILLRKADDSTNKSQHIKLLIKMDSIQSDLLKFTRHKSGYRMIAVPYMEQNGLIKNMNN